MKKISRKLFMSILSMAFAVVALGTTTFAWFTMNATATAGINVGVQSGSDGILISSDCTEFASDVQIASELKLKPLSYSMTGTDLSTTDRFVDMTDSASTDGLFSFDLYFYTDSDNEFYFELGTNSVSTTTQNTYTVLKGFTYGETGSQGALGANQKIKVDATNALRSTFDVYGYTEQTGVMYQQAITAARADDGGSSFNALTFGTPARTNNVFGFTGAGTTTPATINDATDTVYNFGQTLAESNAANSYLKAINGANAFDVLNPDGSVASSYEPEDNYAAITPLNGFSALSTQIGNNLGGYITKATFYFWLEGWDADCFDAVMGQDLNINLAFTTAERATA